jgi:O-antigen/teichoic acid export membrane protein
MGMLQVVDRGLYLLFVVSVVVMGAGHKGVITAGAAAAAISGVLALIFAYRGSTDQLGGWWRASLDPVREMRSEFRKLLGWNYLISSLGGLVANVPVLLLGLILTPFEAGYYRVAANVAMAASYLEGAAWRVAYPEVSARLARDESEVAGILKRWTLQGGLPLAAVVVLGAAAMPIFIPLVFGDPFEPSIVPTQLLLLGVAVSAALFVVQPYFFATQRLALYGRIYLAYTTTVVLGGWLAARQWSYVGLAAAVGGSMVAFNLGSTATLLRVLKHGWGRVVSGQGEASLNEPHTEDLG